MKQSYLTDHFVDTKLPDAAHAIIAPGDNQAVKVKSHLDELMTIHHHTNENAQHHYHETHYHLLLGKQGYTEIIAGNLIHNFTAGSMLLLPPAQIPDYQNSADGIQIIILSFHKKLLSSSLIKQAGILEIITPGERVTPYCELSAERLRMMRELFDKLEKELYGTRIFHEQMAYLTFIELMLQGYRVCTEQPVVGHANNRAVQLTKQFLELADEHYLTKRTVQEYADKLAVSAKYLSEVVKNETGLGPLHHIHQRLFNEARHWLVSANLSIKDVADKLGFDTPSHFSRFFKQYTGYNPTSYQLMHVVI
ncbi:helix-turn-helix domain-containing protein [Mucilaginibacter sp. UR6-1]|uniref:AraC family transcriptional regulator n=1 Tax=Mucilaginibacter sp. UR6-1 TaxID=1435643 RepID=UPI001E442D7F|nr:helix-turn-helix domain-containing protein [Mucilaginibacter sp. UR6-1]MCC8408537.1 helix-turn-helix domain-containing protein [Mucilaginibacter sp. UR6-1]